MGENTPEALELFCPGCGSHFRLKPKKNRLPDGTVPCPKCAFDIPIEDSNDSGKETAPSGKGSKSALGAVVMSRRGRNLDEPEPKAPQLSGLTEDSEVHQDSLTDASIRELDKLAQALREQGSNPNATFMGHPGEGNPFLPSHKKRDKGSFDIAGQQGFANNERTISVDPDLLDKVRQTSKSTKESSKEPRKPSDTLVGRGAPASKKVSDDAFTRETSETTAVKKSDPKVKGIEAQSAQILSKVKSKIALRQSEQEPATPRRKTQAMFSAGDIVSEPSDVSNSSLPKPPKSPRAEEKVPSSADASGEKKDLAKLFKQVKRKKRTQSSAGGLPRPPSASRTTKKADAPPPKLSMPEPGDLSDEDLTAFVDRSTELVISGLKDTPVAGSSSVAKGSQAKIEDPNSATTQHSGLFDNLPEPKIPVPEAKGAQTTSTSMLARLRKRQDVADIEIAPGMASERRGSGYIRLPTVEIQQVLGRGSYRLRIENVIYEPVDNEGLTQLIKGGVLLGAEEIAEAEGDWMPVSEHPVFDNLRRKMAVEAHELLSKISGPRKSAAAPETPSKPAPSKETPQSVVPSSPSLPPKESALPVSADASETAEFSAEAQAAALADVPPDEQDTVDEVNFAFVSEASLDPDPEQTPEAVEDHESEEVEDFDIPLIDAEPTLFGDTVATEDIEEEKEEPPQAVSAPKKRGLALPLIGLVLILGLVAAGVAHSPIGKPYIDGLFDKSSSIATDHEAPPPVVAGDDSAKLAEAQLARVGEAVTLASSHVAKATSVDVASPKLHLEFARERIEAQDPVAASRIMGLMWREKTLERDLFQPYVRSLIDSEQYHQARRVSVKAMQGEDNAAAFGALFEEAIRSDEALATTVPVDLQRGGDFDSLEVHRVGKRRAFKLKHDSKPGRVFTPAQSDWEDSWRAEIAAYRYCELVVCHFVIPTTRPARMSREDVEATPESSAIRSSLIWVREEGPDGVKRDYVHGSLREPIAQSAPWPIEFIVWRDWLNITVDASVLDGAPEQTLARLQTVAEGAFYAPIIAHKGQSDTRDMARQISSILTFDFLTNNWERFADDMEHYGINTPMVDGKLVSINNGAAFQPRASRRVLGRFEWTSRFSKDTVASIRALSPELVNPVLFPKPSGSERAKLNTFWSQRRQMLQRIDKLVARHGEAAVFEFD